MGSHCNYLVGGGGIKGRQPWKKTFELKCLKVASNPTTQLSLCGTGTKNLHKNPNESHELKQTQAMDKGPEKMVRMKMQQADSYTLKTTQSS